MDMDNSTAHFSRRKRDAQDFRKKIPIMEVSSERHNVWIKIAAVIFVVLVAIPLLIKGVVATGLPTVVEAAYNFAAAPSGQINSVNGRVNILVMGKASGSHDGLDLTDTMMLVSVGLSKPSITIISLPRDLWIPEIRAKINSAYYWGKNGSPYLDVTEAGGGIAFAEIIAGEVVGQPIQYGAVIDFSSFKDIIDALGEIYVNVENSFTDKLYPIAGRENDTCGGDPTFACRYQTVTFDAGLQIMNGNTALEFVRSRHAEGIEGTDLAREARQQKVIGAIKNKILKPSVFLSPKVDLTMLSIVKKYVETDINLPTAGVLVRKILDGSKNVNQYLIPQELLVNPPINKTYDSQYVFTPRLGNGKWEEINGWFSSVLH